MHLSLSPEEFERLLKLAYLGEAVLNDWTPSEKHDRGQLSATGLLYDLCAEAEGTPARKYVRFDDIIGEWVPSAELDKEMDDVIARYDGEAFWDELVAHLARRDMVAEYGDDAIAGMSDAYRRQAERPLYDYYFNEIREHGVDRIVIRGEENQLKRRSKSRGGKRGRSRSKDPSSGQGTETAL